VDLLASVFLFCFLFGLAFTLLSFLAGHELHGGHHEGLQPGHADAGQGHAGHVGAGHAHPAGGHGHLDPGSIHTGHPAGHLTHGPADAHGEGERGSGLGSLRLSPSSLAIFLTWVGGAGYATYALLGFAPALGLLIGVVAGGVGAAIVTVFLVKVLIPAQTFLDPDQTLGPGLMGRLSHEIRSGGIGEIVYTIGDTRHSDGARAADGGAIAQGTEVVVTRVERGIAYVQPWSEFVNGSVEKGV
jgi:hypothetical protein